MSRPTPNNVSHRVGNRAYRQLEVEILAVKKDVSRVGQQVAEALGKVATVTQKQANGGYRDARNGINSIVSGVSDRSSIVVDAVHEAATSIEDTLEDAIQARPFASFALAFGLGVLVGTRRRR
jgi:ElaB/YqjD/DUF883 family membrane-anchored ribosome-binding protein